LLRVTSVRTGAIGFAGSTLLGKILSRSAVKSVSALP